MTLLTSRRRTDRDRWPQEFGRLLDRMRRRIETAFSVLTTVFSLEKPDSRSLSGWLPRLTTSVLAYNHSF